MTATMRAHVGIGPVQGFIGEARRSRDWWAGSFLLAWLAGRAMQAAEGRLPCGRCYGRVVEPRLEGDPMWAALNGGALDWPIGTLPNRFVVELDDPAAFAENGPCGRAVRKEFAALASAVWRHFLHDLDWNAVGGLAQRARTWAIWRRQVRAYFEVQWVVGPSDFDDFDLLDRRKLCRDQFRPAEPKDHCRMMGDLQELSDCVRARERGLQDRFWKAVRQSVWDRLYPRHAGRDVDRAEYALLELERTERLSAIALVKRLFPLLPEATMARVVGWNPYGLARGRGQADGRRAGAVRYWPSTATVASLPWRRDVWTNSDFRLACSDFAVTASRVLPLESSAALPRLAALQSIVSAEDGGGARFGRLEGALFYADALDAQIRLASQSNPSRHQRLRTVRSALKRLLDTIDRTGAVDRSSLPGPSPFYAVLVMDGDRIGEAKRRHPDEVGRVIAEFTRLVAGEIGSDGRSIPGLVERDWDGVLIYAGGEDVQALLPLDTAIQAALALQEAFLSRVHDAFGGTPPATDLTVSAAIAIADHGEPMDRVIGFAHRLLKDSAKAANDRNSLAIGLLQRSGSGLRVVSKFQRSRINGPQRAAPFSPILGLAKRLRTAPVGRTTTFLHRVERSLGPLIERPATASASGVGLGSKQRTALLVAEWLTNRELDETERRAAEEVITAIEEAATVRAAGGRSAFNWSGPMLASFLAEQASRSGRLP